MWCQPIRGQWQAELAEEGPSGSSGELQLHLEGNSAEEHTVVSGLAVQMLSNCLASVVVGGAGAAEDQTLTRVCHR